MLSKTFNPQDFEQRVYAAWEKSHCFENDENSKKAPFSLMMPPPNVTGSLHVGHALNHTIQDIICRFQRLCGRDVLWQPGMDHAGIATQMVVERNLEEKGISRHDLGRDEFVRKVWDWKAVSGGSIMGQLRRLGNSSHWDRERFTLDEGLSKAVQAIFIKLYKDGLIYRDKRLVNWDPKFRTAISDLEVINKEQKGKLYHLKYPLANDPNTFIEIATTRPETMLGDTAVAVHPQDERYKHLIGEKIRLPIVDRLIPIIADEYCDQEKGTGAVKITPAHDFNDFEVGRRHDLPLINILDSDARLNDQVPERLQGLDINQARRTILEEFETLGLRGEDEDVVHMVPYGDRSDVVIQPWLTDQWFVDAKVLAKPALQAVQSGKTKFVPEQWTSTYYEWLNNIQPWCISRQLWWGHRIPAWYGPEGKIFVANSFEEAQAQAQAFYKSSHIELTQDPDVLDTWFSSALWAFSTLGWPQDDTLIKRYYPTSVLVTGFDIIFFWVARMMMMSLYVMKDVPFKTVYIHPLVRDDKGQKMSKSKGNVIDPLLMIDKYGADAVRFTIARLAGPGRDMKLGESTFQGYRNFMTKIWNAARFLEMNEVLKEDLIDPMDAQLPVNQWIIHQVVELMRNMKGALDNYRFDEAAKAFYEFTWYTFCDYYLEFLKPILKNGGEGAKETRQTARWIFTQLLHISHPMIPFMTEELWTTFAQADKLLLQQEWPDFITADNNLFSHYQTAGEEINWVIELVTRVRSIRSEFNVPPASFIQIKLFEADDKITSRLNSFEDVLRHLARIDKVETFISPVVPEKGAAQCLVQNNPVLIPLGSSIDIEKEIGRLKNELVKAQKDQESSTNKLNNSMFMERAKPEVIEEMKERFETTRLRIEKIEQALECLK